MRLGAGADQCGLVRIRFLPPTGSACDTACHDLPGIDPAGVTGQILVQQREALACQGSPWSYLSRAEDPSRSPAAWRSPACWSTNSTVLLQLRKALACQEPCARGGRSRMIRRGDRLLRSGVAVLVTGRVLLAVKSIGGEAAGRRRSQVADPSR